MLVKKGPVDINIYNLISSFKIITSRLKGIKLKFLKPVKIGLKAPISLQRFSAVAVV